ncbi:MAG: hypothetical protein NW205_02810 [Hyphomicrobiaceae bacterium]|nr:hypothetical protein [Hyphomicrobiaceae bacterium]
MLFVNKLGFAGAAVAALAFGLAAASTGAVAVAKECFKKAGQGTDSTIEGAKFQVDEVLLQSTDWGAWAEWMATGKTSGYDFGARKYKCKAGGLGYECYGTSTICKK